MNEIVSFTKEIEFNTNIDKIESISIEHTLNLDDNSIVKGDLIISGTYKITPVTLIDSPFSYKVPVDIVMDSKYDLTNMTIDIDNFTYEIKDNNKLSINVDLILDNLMKKEEDEIISVDDLFIEKEEEKPLDIPVIDTCEKEKIENDNTNVEESLFSNLNSTSETYSAYFVYIMNDNDSIDNIMEKYKVSKKDLEEYNNLNELKAGSKIIVPTSNE